MSRKILVAIDDSENAMRAVDYISKVFTKDHEITLFSVLLDTATICDMNSPELIPYFTSQQTIFCSLEDKKKELVDLALEKAKELLMGSGFDETLITTKVEIKKRGVARDIIDEANQGYDTLVIGRRGISGLKEFFLGSVSHKVLNTVKDLSIVLVN
ncbi:universal stress protein [Thermodesulfobacteriota bacterium]